MKIAYFSPLSPIKSGVCYYSENIVLPFLKNFSDVEIIVDKANKPSNEFVKNNFNVKPLEKFDNESYDALVYHLGNNLFHEYVYNTLIKYPGIVVVHDPFIGGLILSLTSGRGHDEKYIEYMEYCIGKKGKKIAENALNTYNWPSFKYPLIKKVADSSKAIIVHGDFAKKAILSEAPKTFVKKLKIPVSTKNLSSTTTKKDLNVSDDTIVISSFGFAQPHKRLELCLKAFAKFVEKFPNSKFFIVGTFLDNKFKNVIIELAKELRIYEKIVMTGYVDDLISYMNISDIAMQCRYPTAGETSLVALEIMAMNKPVIVTDIGWFSELPDDSVVKVEVGKNEEKSMTDALIRLTEDEEFRKKLCFNAKRYVEEEHDPEKVVYELFDFLKIFSNKKKTEKLKNYSMELDGLGIKNDDKPYLSNFVEKIHNEFK